MESLETLVRHLSLRRGRERRGLALAEGVRLVEEVLATGVPIRAALMSPALEATPRGAALASALKSRAPRVESMTDRQLAELAATEHPQGVLVVIAPKATALGDISLSARSVVLVLDAVQDPGNVGTMIRTAYGLGAAGVVALPGSAELVNPKVLRASMGAAFRMPAVAASHDETLKWLADQGAAVWIAAADGKPVPGARRTVAGWPCRRQRRGGHQRGHGRGRHDARGGPVGGWSRIAQRGRCGRDLALRGAP